MGGMLICLLHALGSTDATGLEDLCLKVKLDESAAFFVGVLVREEVGVAQGGEGACLCGVGARSRSKVSPTGDGDLVLMLPATPLLLNGLTTLEAGVEGGVATGVAVGRVGGVEGAELKRLGRLMMCGRNWGGFWFVAKGVVGSDRGCGRIAGGRGWLCGLIAGKQEEGMF